MPADTPPPPAPKIACPVLGLWGDGDPFLIEDGVIKSSERVSGSWRYEKIAGAGHWLMLDKPAEVNRLLVDFLKS